MMSVSDLLSFTNSLIESVIQPYATARTSNPLVQPTTLPRCSRVASPSGVPSDAAACARPRRGGTSPAPRSRRRESTIASDAQRRRGDDHEERPPRLARERAHLLRPSDRRQPRDSAVTDIADGTEHERRPEHEAADAVHDPGVVGDLRGDGVIDVSNSPKKVNETPRTIEPAVGKPTASSESVTSAPVTTFIVRDGDHRGRRQCVWTDRQRTQQL